MELADRSDVFVVGRLGVEALYDAGEEVLDEAAKRNRVGLVHRVVHDSLPKVYSMRALLPV